MTTAPTTPEARSSRLFARVLRLPLIMHAGAAAVAVVAMGLVNHSLERMYVATGYPVSFVEGQTTFSGPTVKRHLAELVERGTLNDFVQVQLFDYIFMVTVALVGLGVGSLLVRLTRGRWRTAGWVVMGGLLAGPAADALENLVSFVMLADPAGFPDVLAVVHSSLAVLKFAAMGLAFAAALLGVLAAAGTAVARLLPKPAH